jgi:hypothetical protein
MNAASPHASATQTPVTNLPRPPHRRWVRLLLALVVFLSGVGVGVGGALIVVRNRVLHAIHHPDEMPALLAVRLRLRLRLSDEQVQRVEAIFTQRQRALQDIRRRVQPDVEAELERVEQQVAAVLDEQQRQAWQRHFQQLRDTWLPALPLPK